MGARRRGRLGWHDPSVPTPDDGPIAGPGGDGLDVVAEALSHTYEGPSGDVPVLRDVTFTIPKGGYAALVGPSGAGKTTLLALIGGLERVQSGRLLVGGHEVAELEGDLLAAYRRTTVGFIFQSFGLLEALTALENVELAAVLAGEKPATRRERASRLLDVGGHVPPGQPTGLVPCRAENASGWPLPGLWSTRPGSSWPTNRRGTSTPTPPTRSCACWSRSRRNGAARSSW